MSTDQVNKPVNTDALTKWVGQIPDDVLRDMATIAPMLERLGYDLDANPPKYGDTDVDFFMRSDRPDRSNNSPRRDRGVNN